MTTVINNPGNGDSSGGAMGLIVGLIVLVIVVALFIVYILPGIRGTAPKKGGSVNVNLQLPANSSQPSN
ncbi:MAG: hypothetical protein V4481_01555 [Patescibacteria group bacterium]